MKKRAAIPRRDDDGDQRRDPPDTLVAMEDVVSAERDQEGQDADDDDADDGREGAPGDGREALPADDAVDDAEPGQRGEVQDHGHRDGVAPEAEARLDHLAQAGPGAQGAQVRGDDGRQEGEEEDDEGAVPEAQAVGGTQHAERERQEIHVHAEPDGELRISKESINKYVIYVHFKPPFSKALLGQHLPLFSRQAFFFKNKKNCWRWPTE